MCEFFSGDQSVRECGINDRSVEHDFMGNQFNDEYLRRRREKNDFCNGAVAASYMPSVLLWSLKYHQSPEALFYL